jgi:hypothetical protein
VHGDVKASTPPGSATYVDPHYLRSGALTKRSDVYSFGVQAFCDGRLLTAAVITPQKMNAAPGSRELVDNRLGCRRPSWWRWPAVSMAGVVRTLENKIKQRQKVTLSRKGESSLDSNVHSCNK